MNYQLNSSKSENRPKLNATADMAVVEGSDLFMEHCYTMVKVAQRVENDLFVLEPQGKSHFGDFSPQPAASRRAVRQIWAKGIDRAKKLCII